MTRPLNPRTAPLGVLLVAGLPTAQAIEAVGALDTPSVIEQAIAAERRCLARSAVVDALQARLAARSRAKAQRRRGEGRTGISACPKRRGFNAEAQRRRGGKRA